MWRSEDDLVGVCFLLLHCGFRRLNLGQQYRPLPSGPSHWPLITYLVLEEREDGEEGENGAEYFVPVLGSALAAGDSGHMAKRWCVRR